MIISMEQNPTLLKLKSFLILDKGWHFGKGVPPTLQVVKNATQMVEQALISLFDTDVFPGIDGEIMITVYHKEHYLEFTIEPNGTVIFVHEINDDDITCKEGLTFDQSLLKLNEFSEQIWNTSALSTKCIMTIGNRTSKAWPSKIHLSVKESPSYQKTVSKNQENMSVNTYQSSTSPTIPHLSPQYIGNSARNIYLPAVFSSNIQAIPAMSVMAT
jgi:hypothetical protein